MLYLTVSYYIALVIKLIYIFLHKIKVVSNKYTIYDIIHPC